MTASNRPFQPDDSPLVSVIMPCWNGSKTIAKAITSVREQTFTDWELVVADDGSTDRSEAIVSEFSKVDPRVKLVAHEDAQSGAAAARNRALRASTGRYIAFLDADDLWLPDKLAVQISTMQKHSLAFSCTSYWVRRPSRPDVLRTPPALITRPILLRGNRIGCLTAVYDSQVLGKQPMPNITRRQDYALWCHLLTLTECAVGIPRPLAIHNRSSNSLSSSALLSTIATWKMFRTEAGLSRRQSTVSLGQHLLNRLLRG